MPTSIRRGSRARAKAAAEKILDAENRRLIQWTIVGYPNEGWANAVFGEPDVELRNVGAGEWQVEVRGMDVYDPATGEVHSDTADGIAAWFLDQDYDRRSFLVSQAFFPGAGTSDPWARLSRNLRGWVDPDAFEMLRGTVSLPFKPGPEQRIAVKVIDFRGNEAIRILDMRE